MLVHPDAVPDRRLVRAQLLFAAREGCRDDLAFELADAAGSAQLDPFPSVNPICRPMDVVLDVEGPAGILSAERVAAALAGIVDGVDGLAHADLSGALVGSPQHLIKGPWSNLRYLYLMRRKADVSRDAYLDHYFHRHSDFARHLKSVSAYNQIHVDPAASKDLARQLGMGVHQVDSVSELSFESVEGFFAGMEPEAAGAAEDELTFVDRANSVSFVLADTPLRAGGVTTT